MKTPLFSIVLLSSLPILTHGTAAAGQDPIARGEYIVKTSGCNDCHTPGYPESGGQVAQTAWLTGNPVGFLGPWGTTYPTNLRLYVQDIDESEWLTRVRRPMRPPMPWFSLRDMTDEDLIAVYRFTRSLGAAGERMPVAAGPQETVETAFIDFVPKRVSEHH